MKKQFTAALALLLTLSLFGCAQKAPAETTTPTTAAQTEAPTTAPAETTEAKDSAALAAYREVLTQIRENSAWPDGTKIELFDAAIDDEQFALADVDGDGELELLVSVSDTYVAGEREAVYSYDAASGQVKEEALSFPGCEYYPGLIKDLSSHNQGYAGDVLWPYGINIYNAETGEYEYKYYVDAWCRALSETNYDGQTYPTDIDVDNDGYVYLITEGDTSKILNKTDYEAWEKAQFAGLTQIDISWQKLTAENVNAVG